MDGFLIVYKRAVYDYILKCFDEGIYGGLARELYNHKDGDAEEAIEIKEEDEVPEPETDTIATEPSEEPQPNESKDEAPSETPSEAPSEATKEPAGTNNPETESKDP
ncbi:hypothetical protein CPC16_006040 [Podila verticillata]|nr:hypothetical protein CPC16_006040 [Podila verticillata]